MDPQPKQQEPKTQKDPLSWSTEDFILCWDRVPEKWGFIVLAAAWALLFQFFGHCQFNYTQTPSLFAWMWGAWSSEALDCEQGKMIPFAMLGIVWFKRETIISSLGKVWWPALIPLFGACLLHLFGYLIQQPRISIIAFFIGLYSLIGLVWGMKALRTTFFPMLLFVFCIPLGSFVQGVTQGLRMFATAITHLILTSVMGIDVVRQGTQLFDPSGAYNYDVRAACSGIRSMATLLAITTIFGMLLFKTLWRRLAMISLAIPLAIICNVLRLVAIVVAAKAFDAHAGELVHEYFGYVTYAVAIGGTMLLARLLREKNPSEALT